MSLATIMTALGEPLASQEFSGSWAGWAAALYPVPNDNVNGTHFVVLMFRDGTGKQFPIMPQAQAQATYEALLAKIAADQKEQANG